MKEIQIIAKIQNIRNAYDKLKIEYDTNIAIFNSLRPKVGEKRKRYWIGI
jgi:hypothetical protein